jgi:hypothetical protein
VHLIIWIYLYHFYYLIIFFVFLVFLYEYRIKTTNPPNISKQPIISTETHEEQKKTETEKEVDKLVNSEEYKAFQKGKYPFIINEE